MIYTTHAIESLNSVIRQATRQRKLFPSDDSAMKVVYLAIQAASKNMDNADPQLETRPESLYDRIR